MSERFGGEIYERAYRVERDPLFEAKKLLDEINLLMAKIVEQGDLSKVNVGPGRADYVEAIKAMASQGIKIVPIDIDQSSKPSQEKREAHLADNLLETFQKNPQARVAVLIGTNHTLRVYDITKDVPSLHQRIIRAGIPTINAVFTGGEENIPRNITESAVQAGLGNTEFMLDMRPYIGMKNVPYGAGEVDFVIHLPQTGSHRDALDRPFGMHLPGTNSFMFGTIPLDTSTIELYSSLLSGSNLPLKNIKEILKAIADKGPIPNELPLGKIEIRELPDEED